MRDTLVVAAREIAERKRIFLAAAFAGLLPFLAPLFPNIARGDIAEVRAVLALIFAFSFGIGTAVVLGSTILVRDLVERRAGFYFARPLPSFAIWGGKILGALLLAAGAGIVCILPAWLVSLRTPLLPGAGLDSVSTMVATFSIAGVVFGGLLFLIALFHAAMVVIRSRSPWLVVDVVLLVVCGIVVGRSAATLIREVHPYAFMALLAWGLPALLLVLLVAGALSVVVGRTDFRRGHGAQSLALWGSIVPLTLAGALYTRWLVSPTPADLVEIRGAASAPAGDWITVAGKARHRGDVPQPFLWNRATGAFVRLPRNAGWWALAEFSPDGRTAIWAALESARREEWRLWRADLTAADPKPRAMDLVSKAHPWIRFSPSGKRIAVETDETLSVLDLDSEKTIAAARIPAGLQSLLFLDEETLRLCPWSGRGAEGSSLQLFEFRTGERKLEKTGAVPRIEGERLSIRYEPGGAKLFAVEADRKKLTLRDGRNGQLLATLYEGPRFSQFVSLPDESVALVVLGEEWKGELRQISREGTVMGITSLGKTPWVTRPVASSDGRLLVGVRRRLTADEPERKGWSLLTIDLSSRRILAETPDLRPLPDGLLASPHLFLDAHGALVAFDPETGERKQLLPKPR